MKSAGVKIGLRMELERDGTKGRVKEIQRFILCSLRVLRVFRGAMIAHTPGDNHAEVACNRQIGAKSLRDQDHRPVKRGSAIEPKSTKSAFLSHRIARLKFRNRATFFLVKPLYGEESALSCPDFILPIQAVPGGLAR